MHAHPLRTLQNRIKGQLSLHLLVGKGRFRFPRLSLKIRGGTGSPARAEAVFEG
jgi:kynurenine formamidase